MSDFFNSGWSLYIAGIVIGGLVFCLFVLAVASKRTVMANDNSTGHIWDEDLKEMNNPLPRWWMGLFLITVAFAAIYLAMYPGLGANEGGLKWSSAGQLQAEQDKARVTMAPVYAAFANLPASELAKNPQAMAIGERLFVNNCAQCHGADAHGSKGFPNLTDSDWLGGDGSPEYIEHTIINGRQGMMPVMAPAVGTPEDVRNVANYVLSLSGSPHNSVAAQLGQAKFAACAACHGADGKGNHAIGAANLTDKIWLHGWGEDAVVAMVTNGKTNVMPPQGSRFTPEQIKVLTAYVWNLSQSTKVAAQ
jgi:cytochrome c oxidase cbb3-type subunit 3